MVRRSLFILAVFLALPSQATTVIFTDGSIMKVVSYEAGGGTAKLKLDGTAAVYVPLRTIDRIVDDDETTPEIEAAMAKVVYEKRGFMPRRSWRFDAHSGPIFRSPFDKTILEAARKFDVDAALVSALIKAESDFNPREVSKKGACGLMQLMPSTAERFGVRNSFDPAANIFAGTRYLHILLQNFHGDADLALAAYNAGEATVTKYRGIPPFRETVTYINRIAGHLMRAVR